MDTKAYSAAILDELTHALGEISASDGEALAELILSAETVFLAGAGRSGLAVRGFAMRLMHMGLRAFVCGETVTPSLQPGDLLLVVSGSGNTGTLRSMAEKAKKLGAHIALLTTRPQSDLGALAELTVRVPAPAKERTDGGLHSVQPMGSLFEQSCQLFLDALVLRLMEKTGESAKSMAARHANLE